MCAILNLIDRGIDGDVIPFLLELSIDFHPSDTNSPKEAILLCEQMVGHQKAFPSHLMGVSRTSTFSYENPSVPIFTSRHSSPRVRGARTTSLPVKDPWSGVVDRKGKDTPNFYLSRLDSTRDPKAR